MTSMENPELEAAIFADRNNTDAWAVYGDWLQTQEDPRGELIALELNQPEKHQKRIQELYNQHQNNWVANIKESSAIPGSEISEPEWKYGFLLGIKLYLRGPDFEAVRSRNSTEIFSTHALAQLEAIQKTLTPSTIKFLKELRIHLHANQIYINEILNNCGKFLDLKNLSHLRFDFLGDDSAKSRDREMIPNLIALLEACPALSKFRLSNCLFPRKSAARSLSHPNLKELIISNYHCNIPALEFIGQANLPALERLLLDFRFVSNDDDTPGLYLAGGNLFKNKGLPGLKELRISLAPEAQLRKLIKTLVDTPLSKQLNNLSIAGPDLSVEFQSEIQEQFPETRVTFE